MYFSVKFIVFILISKSGVEVAQHTNRVLEVQTSSSHNNIRVVDIDVWVALRSNMF